MTAAGEGQIFDNQNPNSILRVFVLEAPTQRLPISKVKFLLIRHLEFFFS